MMVWLHLLSSTCFIATLHHATATTTTSTTTSLSSSFIPPNIAPPLSKATIHPSFLRNDIKFTKKPTTTNIASTTTTTTSTDTDSITTERQRIKNELIKLSQSTNRGFTSTSNEKKRIRSLIDQLSKYNPTSNPASSYNDNTSSSSSSSSPSSPKLDGKWTLIYTDAPDITSLDTRNVPFSTAKLGRIGQECNPPFVNNVIEWTRPDWLQSLPFSSSSSSKNDRILQKVCTEGKCRKNNPRMVDLVIVGLDLVGSVDDDDDDGVGGLWPRLLQDNPLKLRGFFKVPFGVFEILYLDEELRITKTGQNYVAMNVCIINVHDEWF